MCYLSKIIFNVQTDFTLGSKMKKRALTQKNLTWVTLLFNINNRLGVIEFLF